MKKFYTISIILFCCGIINLTTAQFDAFSLLQNQNYAPKPTITPDLVKYFELDGHARELVDMLTGPRPGGFFPEKTYEVAAKQSNNLTPTSPPDNIDPVERAVEQFLAGPSNLKTKENFQFPPGFNQGFSLSNGNKALTSFQETNKPATTNIEEKIEKSTNKHKSSISGIPEIFPELPKYPFPSTNENPINPDGTLRRHQPVVFDKMPEIPKFSSKPIVPEGGLGLAENNVRRHPGSVAEVSSSNTLSSSAADSSQYGTLTDETRTPGGLIGTVLDLFGFNKEGKPTDVNGISKAMSNLLTGNDSPLPAKNMISNVLYKTLTSGSIQDSNNTDPLLLELNSSTPITLNAAQQSAINENLEMIQNLISQPSSPLCNPKPVPVSDFNVDAFMGQWYQVVYSPLLTKSACSVVSYKKLSDVNNGGIGSIFEVFDYTTDGMPYTRPKITSGYAILKQAGELIFRTTAHQDDVNIHVIANGPINEKGEYDFTIMTTNCNYPVYVFARDPIFYKQRYEDLVNEILEQKGIINGFTKFLNIVAPIDASTCTFPPTLFNNKN